MPISKLGHRRLVLSGLSCASLGGLLALAATAQLSAFAGPAPHCATTPAKPKTAPAVAYGTVHFANSCAAAVQPALQLEVARLHSFESAVSRFEAVAARDPGCAIAWWGAAMSARGNPLGGALGAADVVAGRALADKAVALGTGTPREKALIHAMRVYYQDFPDQITRARAYADVMDAAHAADPADPDVAALDGLAIIEGIDLSDRTYARQKRAGAILEAVMAAHPDHPGAPHYLIHAYDYTALAPEAVRAADVYPALATASSHAQHMPSHIWSMLGMWDKSIEANRRSGALIDPEASRNAVRGDIVSAHAFDFIAYARLQRGQDKQVAADLIALKADNSAPVIVQARYPLERGDWIGSASVPVPTGNPFDVALARFTRAYGAARSGDIRNAAIELKALQATRPLVHDAEGEYWAVFVDIYAKTVDAWLTRAKGKDSEALTLMQQAAAMDDGHEKHIYLENKILPVRESLGDMQAGLGHPAEALAAYEASLGLAPNRYRAFLGAAKAAEALGDKTAALKWYEKIIALSQSGDKTRPGFIAAEAYLATNG